MKLSSKGNESESAALESSLGRCFVDGDAAAAANGSRQRRRALGISLVIETVALALLVIAPMMSSVAQPIFSRSTIDPIFSGMPSGRHLEPHRPNSHIRVVNRSFPSILFTGGHPKPRPPAPPIDGGPDASESEGVLLVEGGPHLNLPGNVGITMKDPAPPYAEATKSERKRVVKVTEGVEQAQLILRVEPRYPPLAVQVKKEGTVILQAIISRDGSITSLDVMSGPPLLVQSALEAVRQWRYRPTRLNGEPVEVETTITVIFRLEH